MRYMGKMNKGSNRSLVRMQSVKGGVLGMGVVYNVGEEEKMLETMQSIQESGVLTSKAFQESIAEGFQNGDHEAVGYNINNMLSDINLQNKGTAKLVSGESSTTEVNAGEVTAIQAIVGSTDRAKEFMLTKPSADGTVTLSDGTVFPPEVVEALNKIIEGVRTETSEKIENIFFEGLNMG